MGNGFHTHSLLGTRGVRALPTVDRAQLYDYIQYTVFVLRFDIVGQDLVIYIMTLREKKKYGNYDITCTVVNGLYSERASATLVLIEPDRGKSTFWGRPRYYILLILYDLLELAIEDFVRNILSILF